MSLGDDVAKSQSLEDVETKEEETETKRRDRDVIALLTEDDKMTNATGSKEISDKLMHRQFVRGV